MYQIVELVWICFICFSAAKGSNISAIIRSRTRLSILQPLNGEMYRPYDSKFRMPPKKRIKSIGAGHLVKVTLSDKVVGIFNVHGSSVDWTIKEQLQAYGQDLELVCSANNCCDNATLKRWHGGPDRKLLMLMTGKSTDKAKYFTAVQGDRFILMIRNLTENDLNVNYECSYGFEMKNKLLSKEDVFQTEVVDSLTARINATEGSIVEQDDMDIKSAIIGIVISVVVFSAVIILVVKNRQHVCQIKRNRRTGEPNIEELELNPGEPETAIADVTDGQQSVKLLELNPGEPETAIADVTDGRKSLLYNEEQHKESNKKLTDGSEQSPSQANSSGYSTEEETIPLKAAGFTTTPVTQTTQTISSPASCTVPATRSRLQEVGDNNTEQTDGCPQANIVIANEIQTHGEEDHRCKHSEYNQLKLRKKSFTGTMRFEPNAEQMALAGFFFLVTAKSDYAECFCCGSKRHWKAGDDPFDMSFHSNCHYIRTMRENSIKILTKLI